MSYQFSGIQNKGVAGNPSSTGMQFYNPTKDMNSPLIGQHSQSSNTLISGGLNNFKSKK